MSKVYDFNKFSGNNSQRGEYGFNVKLDYTECLVRNTPPDLKDLDMATAHINYKASVMSGKVGIYDIDFSVNEIELRLEIDDYPNESIIEEIEIKPGVNIPLDRIIIRKGDKIIPTEPTMIEVDMGKSGDVSKFLVEITFGSDS